MSYARQYDDDDELELEDDEDVITLGREELDDEPWDDGPDLGPDERDRDLLDGSWEQRYYAGQAGQRDWSTVYTGLAILVLLSILVPVVLVLQ
ncbi:MAG: hypothetical protein IT303_13800 [Dehalococcoidia bacterium]|nr:hypothetical protein [Dehalococcoidia bacterium]